MHELTEKMKLDSRFTVELLDAGWAIPGSYAIVNNIIVEWLDEKIKNLVCMTVTGTRAEDGYKDLKPTYVRRGC